MGERACWDLTAGGGRLRVALAMAWVSAGYKVDSSQVSKLIGKGLHLREWVGGRHWALAGDGRLGPRAPERQRLTRCWCELVWPTLIYTQTSCQHKCLTTLLCIREQQPSHWLHHEACTLAHSAPCSPHAPRPRPAGVGLQTPLRGRTQLYVSPCISMCIKHHTMGRSNSKPGTSAHASEYSAPASPRPCPAGMDLSTLMTPSLPLALLCNACR